MSDLGYVNELFDNTNEFYSIALEQFQFFKELMGIKVKVLRIQENSKMKKIFGSTYSSTLAGDEEREEFDYVIILNLNDMRNVYSKVAGQMEFYDNENVLKVGDVLTFSRKDQEYKFKVIMKESFSEAEGVLNRYQVMGFVETKVTGK